MWGSIFVGRNSVPIAIHRATLITRGASVFWLAIFVIHSRVARVIIIGRQSSTVSYLFTRSAGQHRHGQFSLTRRISRYKRWQLQGHHQSIMEERPKVSPPGTQYGPKHGINHLERDIHSKPYTNNSSHIQQFTRHP